MVLLEEARLWEGCSKSPYVLGILDGVAMLWFDVLNVQGHTIKRGKWPAEKYLKKWEGTLLVYSVFNTNNKTIYIFTQETN